MNPRNYYPPGWKRFPRPANRRQSARRLKAAVEAAAIWKADAEMRARKISGVRAR
jgi:hypothetical protein